MSRASTEGHLREIVDSPMDPLPLGRLQSSARCNRLFPFARQRDRPGPRTPLRFVRLTVHATSGRVRVAEPVTPILRPHDPPHRNFGEQPAADATTESYRFNKRQGNTKDISR